MQDLNKPLNTVNRSLWEDMRYASDKEVLVKVFFFLCDMFTFIWAG